MNTHQKLRKLAEKARDDLEAYCGMGNPNLHGVCGTASVHLMRLARREGIRVKLCYGLFQKKHWQSHCWIEYDGKCYDITATQFGIWDTVYISNPKNHQIYEKHSTLKEAMRLIDGWNRYPKKLRNLTSRR